MSSSSMPRYESSSRALVTIDRTLQKPVHHFSQFKEELNYSVDSRKEEQREAAMASLNVKRRSDKAKLLRKLQRTVHFEKTLSASSVYFDYLKGPALLTLPSWFVEQHGDKIRKSVLLRSESSAKSWTVNLSILFKNPSRTQVRFAGGWRAFALFNNLSQGDSLIFSLTAVSEFEVYVFRGKAGNPKELQRSNDSEHANASADKVEVKPDFATSYERTPARVTNCIECQALELQKKTGYSQLPVFFKKLTVSNFFRPTASEGGYLTACMEIPVEFRKKYGTRLRSLVKLQGIREESPIQTVVYSESVLQGGNEYGRLCLRTGWRDFAAEKNLEVGQWLELFTLTGDSFFVVRRPK